MVDGLETPYLALTQKKTTLPIAEDSPTREDV